MADYKYYVYSSSMVVGVGQETTQHLTIDGTWADYPYRWEVLTEERLLENEKKAHQKAKQFFEKQKRRELKQVTA